MISHSTQTSAHFRLHKHIESLNQTILFYIWKSTKKCSINSIEFFKYERILVWKCHVWSTVVRRLWLAISTTQGVPELVSLMLISSELMSIMSLLNIHGGQLPYYCTQKYIVWWQEKSTKKIMLFHFSSWKGRIWNLFSVYCAVCWVESFRVRVVELRKLYWTFLECIHSVHEACPHL